MQAKLLGYLPMNFKTKDGDIICGVKIYFAYNDDTQNLKGVKVGEAFVKDDIAVNFHFPDLLNKVINVYFNMKGKFVGLDTINIDEKSAK